jgi:hypothetical protein
VKSVEFLLSATAFTRLVSAGIKESFEFFAERRIHDFHTENHVDVFGCSEREARFAEQEIAGSTTDNDILIFVSGEMVTEYFDAPYHDKFSRSFSAAMEIRSSL